MVVAELNSRATAGLLQLPQGSPGPRVAWNRGRKLGKTPAFLFFPSDWLTDANLRRCSYEARAVWIDMLCIMWDSKPRGILASNGQAWSDEEIAQAIPGDTYKNLLALQELIKNGVARRRKTDQAVYSKRILFDEQNRRKWRKQKKL